MSRGEQSRGEQRRASWSGEGAGLTYFDVRPGYLILKRAVLSSWVFGFLGGFGKVFCLWFGFSDRFAKRHCLDCGTPLLDAACHAEQLLCWCTCNVMCGF